MKVNDIIKEAEEGSYQDIVNRMGIQNWQPKFQLISQAPLTLKYGKQTFVRGTDNQWRYFGDKKATPLDPNTQRVLNAQARQFDPADTTRHPVPQQVQDADGRIFTKNSGEITSVPVGTWYDDAGNAVTDSEAVRNFEATLLQQKGQ